MDFDADLLEHAHLELKALDVDPPNDVPTDCALLLFKLRRRCPMAQSRRTELARTFFVLPELQSGLSGLLAAIHRGDSLAPYLSRSTFKPERTDSLLDDWGLLHFHLGTKFVPSGLKAPRSSLLALCDLIVSILLTLSLTGPSSPLYGYKKTLSISSKRTGQRCCPPTTPSSLQTG